MKAAVEESGRDRRFADREARLRRERLSGERMSSAAVTKRRGNVREKDGQSINCRSRKNGGG